MVSGCASLRVTYSLTAIRVPPCICTVPHPPSTAPGAAIAASTASRMPAGAEDGYRVLVDRLWPRGCSKASLPLDGWLRELAPSDEVRRAFAHEP